MSERPAFITTVQPMPCVDPIRSLRWGLKLLLRGCRLRVIAVREQHGTDDSTQRFPIADNHMTAAADVPQEKRSIFLERIAMLNMRGRGRFNDAEFDRVSLRWPARVWSANRHEGYDGMDLVWLDEHGLTR